MPKDGGLMLEQAYFTPQKSILELFSSLQNLLKAVLEISTHY